MQKPVRRVDGLFAFHGKIKFTRSAKIPMGPACWLYTLGKISGYN